VPPVLYERVPLGLLNHAGRRKKQTPNLAFFQGKLNLHIPYEYSFGVRQVRARPPPSALRPLPLGCGPSFTLPPSSHPRAASFARRRVAPRQAALPRL